MSRPALSASRSLDIIELLAMFPDRRFTLSDIAKATEINLASTHAIINVMVQRGYLTRDSKGRTYGLGPALIASGIAALDRDPIVSRASDKIRAMRDELDLTVTLNQIVDDTILTLLSAGGSHRREEVLRPGERLPLVAPFGAPFLAWASDAEVSAWLARRERPPTAIQRKEIAQDLKLTRERGYQVTLHRRKSKSIGMLMADMAGRSEIRDYRGEMTRLVQYLDSDVHQPETFEDDAYYDIMMIAAPIFNKEGEPVYSLALTGFPAQLSGRSVSRLAEKLALTCLELMQKDRGTS